MARRRLLGFALALAAQVALLGSLNLFDDWRLEQMPVRFVVAGMLCGLAYLFAASRFPASLPARKQALLLWSIAVALRVLALPLEPGDDFWRYVWEGKIQHAGFNPYVQAPDDPALEGIRDQYPNWGKINHRDFSAIYPPGTELAFRALSRVSDSPLLYKILFAAADLGSVAVLLRLLAGSDRYASAAWYAWNPLVVYSFAGAAHFDSVLILPMLTGILFLARSESAPSARAKWLLASAAAALLGVAISIKLIPLLLLPLCVFALRSRATVLAVTLAIPGSLCLLYGWPEVPIWDSLRRFAYVTRLNDLFWWTIEETVWPNPHQKNYHYNVALVAVVIVLSILFWRDWKRGMLWVLGAALILTPVLHPWYCTWILPLAVWRRTPAWQVLSVTLFAYYLFWNEQLFAVPWHAELWMRAIIIVPPLLVALWFQIQRPTTTTADVACST